MFRETRFRFSGVHLGSVLTLLLLLFVLLMPGGFQPGDFLLLWIMLIFIWACVLILRFAFPVYVGADGIRASDGIGRFHDVRWEEMQKVSNLFGFYWVRHGKRGKALSIPMFLEDPKAFRAEVFKLSPDDNALRLSMQRSKLV